MEKKPKVSIIIPTFNNEKYIGAAISSALNQTYPNLEIIIVDDGSKDETESIVNKFKNKNIFYLKLEKNLGVSRAKNLGIKHSTGDYIAFLDSDDMYLTDKIEEQINVFRSSTLKNKRLGYVYCGIQLIDEYQSLLTNEIPTGEAWDGIINKDFIGATALVKRKCFEDAGMFDPDLKYFEDMDLYLRINLCGYEYDYIEKPVYIYRKHNTNVSNNRKLMLENVDKYFSKYLAKPEFKKNKKILSQYFMKKGHVLILINPVKAVYYIFLSFILNPFVVINHFYKQFCSYLTLTSKKCLLK